MTRLVAGSYPVWIVILFKLLIRMLNKTYQVRVQYLP